MNNNKCVFLFKRLHFLIHLYNAVANFSENHILYLFHHTFLSVRLISPVIGFLMIMMKMRLGGGEVKSWYQHRAVDARGRVSANGLSSTEAGREGLISTAWWCRPLRWNDGRGTTSTCERFYCSRDQWRATTHRSIVITLRSTRLTRIITTCATHPGNSTDLRLWRSGQHLLCILC